MTDDVGGGGASRSTDPAAGTSSATDVSLREYLTALINATEKRSDARFEAMKNTIETAFASAQTAIDKAEEATEKRFEGVNEFRAALSDQAAHFVTRQTLDALVEKLEQQIGRNREDLDALAKRLDVREGQLPTSLGQRVDDISKRIDVREGEIKGSKVTYGNIAAMLATFAVIIGIVVVLSQHIR